MVGEIVRIMLNRDKDMTNDLGKLDWVLNLRDYVDAASIPSNAEEIYSIALNYLNSDGYKKTWNQNNQHPMSDEEWSNWGGIVVKYLLNHGFSENNFKILIQQSIGGVFEYSFILGTILENNHTNANQWSESQNDWDNIQKEIQELPLC